MGITIQLPIQLADAVGANLISMDPAPATVASAINLLVDHHPNLREQLLSSDGHVEHFYHLYVNGHHVPNKDYNLELNDGDELIILTMLSGG